MLLKLPPKEALEILDQLIQEGTQLIVDGESPGQGSIVGGDMFADPEVNPEFDSWTKLATRRLMEIFYHNAPSAVFVMATIRYRKVLSGNGVSRMVDAFRRAYPEPTTVFELRNNLLEILLRHFREINEMIVTPLFYISSRRQIIHNDQIVELQPDTREAAFCELMFQHSIGEPVSVSKLYKAIINDGEYASEQKVKIKHLVDSVNSKTRLQFQFPIYRMKGVVCYTYLPSGVSIAKTRITA